MSYPTHLLLHPGKVWFELERGPWDADDHGFERPGGAKAQIKGSIKQGKIQ